MDFKAYFLNLDQVERERYAKRAGTSAAYIQQHLLHRRKTPRRETLQRLAQASKGQVSYDDLIRFFFYPEETA